MGVKMVYPDGSQDIFGLTTYFPTTTQYSSPGPVVISCFTRFLLTQRIDAQGRVTQLGYQRITLNPLQHAYRLKYVIDPDYRTNTFIYPANNTLQLTEIDDPYGMNTRLRYSSTGLLTNVIDAVGLTNSFQYPPGPLVTNWIWDGFGGYRQQIIQLPSNGWITNLTTPYGSTRFTYHEQPDPSAIDGFIVRAVCVTEPQQAGQLFAFFNYLGGLVEENSTSPTVPGQTFDDGNAGSNHQSLENRNTFYWGRRQYAALSANVLALLPSDLPDALANLTSEDFRKGRLRHWLWQSDNVSLSEAMSSERDPSTDGQGENEGLRTWYNYVGQSSGAPEKLENDPQVNCVARLLPDSTSQYTLYTYNPGAPLYPPGWGFVSNNISSCTLQDGTVGTLTNWFGYAANNVDLITISNSAGQWVNIGYNANHEITSITNALKQITTLTWDATTFNLTGVQWPNGSSVGLGYYTRAIPPTSTSALLNQLTISPEGRAITINDYAAGNPSSITDDRNVTLTLTWDGLNRPTSITYPDTSTVLNVYTNLDLVATKDRMGYWTRYVYDGLDHLTAITNANNKVTQLQWCGCDALTDIYDALNEHTQFSYDNQGNLSSVIFPDNRSLNYQYDSAGRMFNVSDGASRSLQVSYNVQGLPTTITGASGVLRHVDYDAMARPVYVTDAIGITVTNEYDLINELLTRTWPDNISENFGYGVCGLVAYTNRDNQATFLGYDNGGRLTSVTNANLEVTTVAYDSLDHITDLWDGNTHHTLWQYNEYGWLTNKVNDAGSNVARYFYNTNGWITNRWTPEKGDTRYGYDAVGNLTSITYVSSAINYIYDDVNRLTRMTDRIGTTDFGYTTAGRLQSETGPWPNDAVNYIYNEGLRAEMDLDQPGGQLSQSYTYDSMWRMKSVNSSAGNFVYSYDFAPASSLISGISLPNAGSIANTYDSLGRLLSTTLLNSSLAALDSESYTYDPAGYRSQQVFTAGNYMDYTYDSIGQLATVRGKEPPFGKIDRLQEQSDYYYDPAGNLSLRLQNGIWEAFNVNNLNQITNIDLNVNPNFWTLVVAGSVSSIVTNVEVSWGSDFIPPCLPNEMCPQYLRQAFYVQGNIYCDYTFATAPECSYNAGTNYYNEIVTDTSGSSMTTPISIYILSTNGFNYDQNGNLTNDDVRVFGYDTENELTNIFIPGQWQSAFVYDGLGRQRIERDYKWDSGISNWVQTNEVHYIYDGNLILQERDGKNNPLVTYTRSADLGGGIQTAGGIGGLLARTDNRTGGSAFYHADGSGNVMALVNGSQNVVARYLYNPFGQIEGKWGALVDANTMQFSSMPFHNLSGLSLYPFRAYSPNLQRWLNQDPIGENGGINLYRFVANNPIDLTDPLGFGDNAMMGLGGAWNSDIYGPGGSFYAPGYAHVEGPWIPGGSPLDLLRAFGDALDQSEQETAQDIANFLGKGDDPSRVAAIKHALDLPLIGMPESELGNLGKLGRVGKLTDCPPKFPKLGWRNTPPYKDALKKIRRGSLEEGDSVDLGFTPTEEQARQLLQDAGIDMSKIRVENPHLPPYHTYRHINYPTSGGGRGTIRIQ